MSINPIPINEVKDSIPKKSAPRAGTGTLIISSITRQVKNTERASIFINGKYSFSLSLDELVKQRLKKDQHLSHSELKALQKISHEDKIRINALSWLLLRPHSARELNDYFKRKQIEPDFAVKLIADFTTRGYLDDQKFAEWWYEQRSIKNKSHRSIKNELFLKGISSGTISEVLSSAENNDMDLPDEKERLRIIMAKKIGHSRYQQDPAKLWRYFINLGFGYSDVKAAWQELSGN